MTALLGNVLVEDPCIRCGGRWIWLLKYSSGQFDRFVCICEKCGNSVVVQPKRAIAAKAQGQRRSLITRQHLDYRV